jgi:hypothetical protein
MATDTSKQWKVFIINYSLARDYNGPQMLASLTIGAPNPLLNELLPTLLFINMLSILDAALTEYANSGTISIPASKNKGLDGRLKFFSQKGLLRDYQNLDELRKIRNALVHEVGKRTDWAVLGNGIKVVEEELIHLGMAEKSREYEPYGERKTDNNPTNPRILFSHNYVYGLKEKDSGKKVCEFRWRVDYHKSQE